jgi:hypothetical protein
LRVVADSATVYGSEAVMETGVVEVTVGELATAREVHDVRPAARSVATAPEPDATAVSADATPEAAEELEATVNATCTPSASRWRPDTVAAAMDVR